MIAGLWVASLAGCIYVTSTLDTPEAPMLSTSTASLTSNDNALLHVDVDIADGETAFQVTAVGLGDNDYLTLNTITDPNGEVVLDANDWLGGHNTLTDAFYLTGPVGVAQWPIRGRDGPLEAGTYRVTYSTWDLFREVGNRDAEVTTLVKRDPDLSTGVVHVRILWTEGLQNNAALVSAMAEAVERWREVWGNNGLILDETYVETNIDPELPFSYEGSAGIRTQAEDGSGHDLQLVVGDYIDGQRGLFGLAAGIPGSVVPTDRTFVLVSWLTHSGADGQFDDDEIRLMGETLAHECGHFMGLAHPVEFSYADWDALSDTEECNSMSECEDLLGNNLMFPYPICTFSGCDPQGQLTDDQSTVGAQYLGTLD